MYGSNNPFKKNITQGWSFKPLDTLAFGKVTFAKSKYTKYFSRMMFPKQLIYFENLMCLQ